jgi:hypothetical protein
MQHLRSTVSGTELAHARFACCEDQDLHPFRCTQCQRIMVFCDECGTLFPDLSDLRHKQAHGINHFDAERPAFPCPGCGHAFEFLFLYNHAYEVPRDAFLRAGLGGLLEGDAGHAPSR